MPFSLFFDDLLPLLKTEPRSKLHIPRIPYRRRLSEGGAGSRGIDSRSPCSVGNQVIAVVERIERFGNAFDFEALGESKGAAQASIESKEVEAHTCVTADDCSKKCLGAGVRASVRCETEPRCAGTLGGRLFCIRSCCDVVGKTGIVLKNASELPAMSKMFGEAVRLGCWRIDGGVEDDAVTLVVVRSAAVHEEVEVVNGRAKKEFSNVVDGFGPGVGDSHGTPRNGPLEI